MKTELFLVLIYDMMFRINCFFEEAYDGEIPY